MRMKAFLKVMLIFLGLLVIFNVTGCWWNDDGNNATVASSTIVNGSSQDGYIAGATIEIYSDSAMTKLIGRGKTDSTGHFSIDLGNQSVPDPMYIKSTGGVDLEFSTEAPDLHFVAPAEVVKSQVNSGDGIAITPVSDVLFKGVISTLTSESNFALIYDKKKKEVKKAFGLDGQDDSVLFTDPNKLSGAIKLSMETAIDDVAASQTQNISLKDGKYLFTFVGLDSDRLFGDDDQGNPRTYTEIPNIVSDNELAVQVVLGVKNNKITLLQAPQSLSDGTMTMEGRVNGSSFMLLFKEMDNGAVSYITRLTGKIGTLGSVKGVFSGMENQNGTFNLDSTGGFVGTFIPLDANNKPDIKADGVNKLAEQQLNGKYNIIFRGGYATLNDSPCPIAWGNVNLTFTVEDNGVRALTFEAASDLHITFSSFTPAEAGGSPVKTGRIFVEDAKLFKPTEQLMQENNRLLFSSETGIVFVKTRVVINAPENENGGPVDVFFIFPLGSREGLALVTAAQDRDYNNDGNVDDPQGRVYNLGDIYLSKKTKLQVFNPDSENTLSGKTTTAYYMVADPELVGKPRDNYFSKWPALTNEYMDGLVNEYDPFTMELTIPDLSACNYVAGTEPANGETQGNPLKIFIGSYGILFSTQLADGKFGMDVNGAGSWYDDESVFFRVSDTLGFYGTNVDNSEMTYHMGFDQNSNYVTAKPIFFVGALQVSGRNNAFIKENTDINILAKSIYRECGDKPGQFFNGSLSLKSKGSDTGAELKFKALNYEGNPVDININLKWEEMNGMEHIYGKFTDKMAPQDQSGNYPQGYLDVFFPAGEKVGIYYHSSIPQAGGEKVLAVLANVFLIDDIGVIYLDY
jgi:hypothetical protein